MRCYRTSTGLFVGTQAEGGDAFSRIVVPDDKPALLNFLNALAGEQQPEPAERVTPSAPPPIQPAPSRQPTGPITLADAETFIQEADHRQLASLAENVILRMRELGKGAGL
ncbi:hypothetical protein [Sphingomonas sp. SRS2]|uniref:hypothetical protein n=1 Tax=Sphingomonas sp. SRS2 TaxID=133190 RepID=UPI0006184328|nr:hypothetical protein [Sphingomonas sp. SRS2]KKC24895.1 hypothetical protein WP12_16845 [Sphingomonas sp. SRS2]